MPADEMAKKICLMIRMFYILLPVCAGGVIGHTRKGRRPQSMDRKERRQRTEKAHQNREREANLAALRQIRDDPKAAPKERLEATRLISDLENPI